MVLPYLLPRQEFRSLGVKDQAVEVEKQPAQRHGRRLDRGCRAHRNRPQELQTPLFVAFPPNRDSLFILSQALFRLTLRPKFLGVRSDVK
jgi:hypothetical protein